MNEGDVVTAMTMAGEIVGKLVSLSENGTVVLNDPRTLINNEQGVGFAKGLCMTGDLDPTQAVISNCIFVMKTGDEFEKAYRQSISGLIL